MLTADRDVPFKVQPLGTYNEYPVADGEVLYANSLAVLNDDQELEPASSTAEGKVVYVPKQYQKDGANMHFDSQQGGPQLAKVYSGVIAILNSAGLTKADVGATAYATSDHEFVTSQGETDSDPEIGVVQKVIDATTAEVYIHGTLT